MKIGWKSRTVDPTVASFRYRVLKPIEALQRRGHSVELFSDERILDYDQVIFSKSYAQSEQKLAQRLREAGKAVVLDLCDNHFYNPNALASYEIARRDLIEMLGLADSVICSTPALARVVMREAGMAKLPKVVGDIFEEPIEAVPVAKPSIPSLLWFGFHGSPNAPAGLADILNVADELARAYAHTPFELVVVTNNRAKFDALIAPLNFATRYVEWTPDSFAEELAGAQAVILPLSDNPFVACKTHNRLSLALAAGVPVVADIIESYREFAPFCYLGNWRDGLAAVLQESAEARRRAAPARAYLETYWSVEAVAPQWETALNLSERKVRSVAPQHRPENGAERPFGELRMSVGGHIAGWIQDPRKRDTAVDVKLTVNGEAKGVTCADMPAVRADDAGEISPNRRGGFVFPRELVGTPDDPLLRCTLSLAATGEPVVNGMLDVHRPSS